MDFQENYIHVNVGRSSSGQWSVLVSRPSADMEMYGPIDSETAAQSVMNSISSALRAAANRALASLEG